MSHFQTICLQHGYTVAQCRCPSPDKSTTWVPCPGPVGCGGARFQAEHPPPVPETRVG